MLLDLELSSDAIWVSMQEYDHKTMEKMFGSVEVSVINVRGQFKKKLTIYLQEVKDIYIIYFWRVAVSKGVG